MATFPLAVFQSALDKALVCTVRPPSKKHLGKELRKSDMISTHVDVINDQFSTERSLPAQILCILPEQDTYVVATSHHVSFVYRLNV